jgi:hypothetical protein
MGDFAASSAMRRWASISRLGDSSARFFAFQNLYGQALDFFPAGTP